ncbi:MAG: cytochrome c biogenesis protein CcsA [Actinobacteria bacterium]|nr:cytochrome c biogenesis protein CcsA [Actinomycetota bacterium]
MIDQQWEVAAFAAGLVGSVLAWIAAIAGEVFESRSDGPRRRARLRTAYWSLMAIALLGQSVLLVGLSIARGTIAVYNQAEFLLAFSWGIGMVTAYFLARRGPWWVAILALPVSFLILGYILLIPGGSGEVSLASLRSVWLLLHILTSIVAYSAFTVTFGAGLLILLRRYLGVGRRYDPAAVNRVGYRAAVLGFPFMTMVLFTGALWAKYIGGVYWAWDPIETWALVTWLIYSAYLHAQYTRGWESVRAAWLSVIGFACIISTYLFFTHFWF